MPLESIHRMMHRAQSQGYAIGYFESWNLESLQGVVDAAEATRSPVILGFNGEFLRQRPHASVEELPVYAALGRAVAAAARVPCGLIFNECGADDWVEAAIHAGFNLVMPADPDAGREEYTARVRRLVEVAHARQVAVEAEIDELPCGEHAGGFTDADVAAAFVASTGVDLLAVSVGNEHIKLEGRSPLDFTRLEALQGRLRLPLVLHGGSGIEDESLRKAVRLGVRKVNYGTYIKQRYLAAITAAIARPPANPHEIVGGPREGDLLVIGRRAVRDAVLERIELLGGCGRG